MPYSPAPVSSTVSVAAPTAISSVGTLVMLGLAGSITPQVSGRILVICSGVVGNTTAIGDGVSFQLSYGTGAAPSNAGALAGTQVGSLKAFVASTTAGQQGFCASWIVTGLSVPSIDPTGKTTAATTYWLDLAVEAITGGGAVMKNVDLIAIEL